MAGERVCHMSNNSLPGNPHLTMEHLRLGMLPVSFSSQAGGQEGLDCGQQSEPVE